MSWSEGNQKRALKENYNEYLNSIEGFLEEDVAKQHLYKFLRENITFTTSLVSGVDLFPLSAYGY